jgi:hypothetical protein
MEEVKPSFTAEIDAVIRTMETEKLKREYNRVRPTQPVAQSRYSKGIP